MVKEFKDKFGNVFTPGKLSDKIKALNSSRVFKKVTPKGDLSWYIKWASSIVILSGMVYLYHNEGKYLKTVTSSTPRCPIRLTKL